MRSPRRRASLPLLGLVTLGLLALAASGCGRARIETEAEQAFARFQDALLTADRGALRELLTRESRAILGQLPLERAAGKERLRVVATRRADPEVLLAVADPNEGGRRSTFVLVREDGALRVDLVATTAFNHEERPNPNGRVQIVPRDIDPLELARMQAAAARPGG